MCVAAHPQIPETKALSNVAVATSCDGVVPLKGHVSRFGSLLRGWCCHAHWRFRGSLLVLFPSVDCGQVWRMSYSSSRHLETKILVNL